MTGDKDDFVIKTNLIGITALLGKFNTRVYIYEYLGQNADPNNC
jgi:hypothetical protein